MFASLALSDRQYFVPDGICRTFRDSSGNPVDLKIQKDATEFFGEFFEKLDDALKKIESKSGTKVSHTAPSSSNAPSSVLARFKGTMVTQIMYGDRRRENHQDFLNVPLTVKNTKTMSEIF